MALTSAPALAAGSNLPSRRPGSCRGAGKLKRLEADVMFEKIAARAKSQRAHAAESK
jgi:hypothetical protein